MTTPDAERQVQPIGRFWNEVAAGGPARPADLDHDLAETIRRLQAIGAAPTPDPAFAAKLWEGLMDQAHAAPLPHPRLVPTPTGGPSGPAPAAKRPARPLRLLAPGRWWPRLEFVAVALLAVTLAGGLAAINGGLLDRLGAFVAQDDESEDEGSMFGPMGSVVDIGDDPVDIVVRRVTLAQGARWETPEGFSITTLESGTLVTRDDVPGAVEQRMRAGSGSAGTADSSALHNDQAEPAVLLQALIGPALRNPAFPEGVTAEVLGSASVATLPAGPSFASVEEVVLAPSDFKEIDTGRDGLALIMVEDGTFSIGGQAGRVELPQTVPDRAGAATAIANRRQLPSSVPLGAGDTALLQGGAVLYFTNEGDDRAGALVLTVNPGTAQTQIYDEGSETVAETVYGTPPPEAMGGSYPGPEVTPSADAEVVAAAECNVAPRSAASLEALLAAGPASTPSVEEQEVSGFRYEDQLPQGTPLDAATLAEITEVEREFAACINSGEWSRNSAFFTDDLVRDLLGDEEIADLFLEATPEPLLPDEQIGLFPLRDARTLPDGRVAAIVDWVQVAFENTPREVNESNFRICEEVDGRWLIAEEISTGR